MTHQQLMLNKQVSQKLYVVASFSPLESPDLAEQYLNGHHQVLMDHGIQRDVRSAEKEWCKDDGVVAIGLFHGSKMIGGVKLHKGLIADLPFVNGLGDSEFEYVKRQVIDTPIHEICGLWLSSQHLKKGLSEVLVRAGLTSWLMSGGETLLTFASQYTLSMTIDLGFEILSLGEGRMWMPYPNDQFKSYVLACSNESGYVKSAHRKVIREIMSNSGIAYVPELDYKVRYDMH